jgi:hypothetical protein
MFNFTEKEMTLQLQTYFIKNKIYDNPEMTNLHSYYLYNKLSFEQKNPFTIKCPTEIRDSTLKNAGKGLFASVDIKKGAIISIYPAHGVLYTEKNQGIVIEEYKDFFDDIFKNNHYAFNIPKEPIQLFGYPKCDNENWLNGHIANDYAYSPSIIHNNKCPHEISAFLISYILNQKHNNASIKVLEIDGIKVLTLKAIVDIKKDSEIFISYQPSYWLSRFDIKLSKEEQLNILMYYLLNKPPSTKRYYYNLFKKIFKC